MKQSALHHISVNDEEEGRSAHAIFVNNKLVYLEGHEECYDDDFATDLVKKLERALGVKAKVSNRSTKGTPYWEWEWAYVKHEAYRQCLEHFETNGSMPNSVVAENVTFTLEEIMELLSDEQRKNLQAIQKAA